jgi:plastocyanin
MTVRMIWRLALGLILAGGLAGTNRPAAAAEERCFEQTGFCIDGRFREYWEQNGGLAVFGYPITAPRDEVNRDTGGTYQTQWFERNRFELHPENSAPYDVLLGLLGKESLPSGLPAAVTAPEAGAQAGCRWFAVTGHNVCNQGDGLGFRAYWESHGLEFDGRRGTSAEESLALFGYPLSAPTSATNSSGDTVLTQWFERARFEWHPGNPAEFRVLLGLLGKEISGAGGGAGATVQIKVFAFQPSPLQVKLGTTVTWRNGDDIGHTVTSGAHDSVGGPLNSAVLNLDDGYSFTFDQAGSYAYFCQRHPSMKGVVEVAP